MKLRIKIVYKKNISINPKNFKKPKNIKIKNKNKWNQSKS